MSSVRNGSRRALTPSRVESANFKLDLTEVTPLPLGPSRWPRPPVPRGGMDSDFQSGGGRSQGRGRHQRNQGRNNYGGYDNSQGYGQYDNRGYGNRYNNDYDNYDYGNNRMSSNMNFRPPVNNYNVGYNNRYD
ncbi:hypothetical protein HDE_09117 [Halotydeus destructor]|nr:hypothetical protein HDE_09117 [Halotydeus destructor]